MSRNKLMFNHIFGESLLNVCCPLFCFRGWQMVSEFQPWDWNMQGRQSWEQLLLGKVGILGL